jgi:integrase
MARRGANEGNIYLRRDGRWEARVQVGWDGGRRRRKSFYGKTRRGVQEQLTRALRDLQQGLPVATDERQTVENYLRKWLTEVVRPAQRPRTYTTYEGWVRCHLVPELGRIRLVALTPQHVQSMMNRLLASGLSPRSVLHLRAVLRTALNQAVRWGVLRRNVAALVDPPHVPRFEIHPFSPDEARAFLVIAAADRLGALYTVALAVGLRQGEALGLQWEDLDLDRGLLTVRHALQRIDGKLQLAEPKTQMSRRTIALPTFAVVALRRHRGQQLREQLWAGSRWRENALVFTSTVGTPLDGSAVTRRLQRLLIEANLPKLRFHDLRHSAATLLLVQGVHVRVVMETLGHSQVSLTLNTYSHVSPTLQREAAMRMEDLLAT